MTSSILPVFRDTLKTPVFESSFVSSTAQIFHEEASKTKKSLLDTQRQSQPKTNYLLIKAALNGVVVGFLQNQNGLRDKAH
jgi:hypothetical protein